MAGSSHGAEGPVKVCGLQPAVVMHVRIETTAAFQGAAGSYRDCSLFTCSMAMHWTAQMSSTLLTQHYIVPADAEPGDAAGRPRFRGRYVRHPGAYVVNCRRA